MSTLHYRKQKIKASVWFAQDPTSRGETAPLAALKSCLCMIPRPAQGSQQPPLPPQTPEALSLESSNSPSLSNRLHWVPSVSHPVKGNRGHQLRDDHQGLGGEDTEGENWRDASADGKAQEADGEQEANSEADEEEEEAGRRRRKRKAVVRKRMERKAWQLRAQGSWRWWGWRCPHQEAQEHWGWLDSKKGKIELHENRGHHDLFNLHFPYQTLNMVTFKWTVPTS